MEWNVPRGEGYLQKNKNNNNNNKQGRKRVRGI
jgi:hypothetical protein